MPAEFHFLRPEWLLAVPLVMLLAWLLHRRRLAPGNWQRVIDPALAPHVLARRGEQGSALRWWLLAPGGWPPEIDVLEADYVGNGTIGLHIHDDESSPGVTTNDPLPYFSDQPFQIGIDLFLPASPTGEGTITVSNIPRGDTGRVQTINVPNWPSSGHSISVVFTDYPVS